jgi:hypothetical protein
MVVCKVYNTVTGTTADHTQDGICGECCHIGPGTDLRALIQFTSEAAFSLAEFINF